MTNSLGQAELLILEGELEQAGELLSSILIEEPDNIEAVLFQGIVYAETHQEDKAIKALNYFIRHDELNPEAWEALGCAWFRKGSTEKGKEFLEKAYNLNSDCPSILRNLGILEERSGNYNRAFSLLKQSYLMDSKDYRTIYALAYGYLNKKEKKRALEHFTNLLSMSLPDDIREEVYLMHLRLKLNWI